MRKNAAPYNVPRGTAYLTSTQVVLYATYFVFYVVLARILSPPDVGLVFLLASAQSVFTTVTSLSLPSAATRFISANLAAGDIKSASAVARTVLRISILAASTGLILVGIVVPLIVTLIAGAGNLASLLVVTFLGSFFLDLVAVYTAFFLGVGRYAATLYQNVAYVPVSRGLGLFLAYRGYGVLGIVIGWAVGGFVALLISLYLWHRGLPRSTSYPIGPLLAFSLPVLASSLIILGQQWGDLWVLQTLLASTAAIGPYAIVVSSVTFLSILWIPVSQAIYPSLSASFSTGRLDILSEKLSLAFRLVNLAVLPVGVALAAVSPTALLLVYGRTYSSNESLTMSILALSAVFTAQGALLFVTLQALGRTRKYLEIALASTIIYLVIVATGVKALQIGTLAGAVGRAILAISTVLFANFSLRRTVPLHTLAGVRKSIMLAMAVGLPLLLIDQFFLRVTTFGFGASLQLVILLGIFVLIFGFGSRFFHVFHHGDFVIVRDALPRRFQPYLRLVQRLILSTDDPHSENRGGPGGI